MLRDFLFAFLLAFLVGILFSNFAKASEPYITNDGYIITPSNDLVKKNTRTRSTGYIYEGNASKHVNLRSRKSGNRTRTHGYIGNKYIRMTTRNR